MSSAALAQGGGPVIRWISPGPHYTNTVTPISIRGENLARDARVSIYAEDMVQEWDFEVSGWAQNVCAQGNYAYVAADTMGLQIVDVSQPDQPVLRGGCDTPGWACGVQILGEYAYVADGYSGLQIIDVSKPDQPVLKGNFNTAGYAYGVYVRGSSVYVADGACGLQIIDVSQPDQPVLTGSFDTPGSARGVFVAGDYAWVADNDFGLEIIAIGQPDKPVLTGSYDTPGHALGVFVAGDYAYVADGDFGLLVIDIQSPGHPKLKGSYDFDPGSGWACGISVSGNYAYLTDGYTGLLMLDISYPSGPVLKGTCHTQGDPCGAFVLGDYAYVADGGSGLRIINISHIDSPALSRNCNTPGWAYGTFILGDYAYVADGDAGIAAVDLGNIDHPTLAGAGSCDTPGRTYEVFAVDNYAYLADGDAGLQVIDISHPERPVLKGSCDTPGNAQGVFTAGDYALVADSDSGLAVIDISRPEEPTFAASCKTPGSCQKVCASGNHAFVADGSFGLTVIDITRPDRPIMTGRCDTRGSSQDVFIAGNYAYVADGDSGMAIIDISRPDRPIMTGECDTPGSSQGIFVSGDYAYVADGDFGLAVIDITRPERPLLMATLGPDLSGQVLGLFLSQDHVFLASGSSGLQILPLPCFGLARIEQVTPDGKEATAILPFGLAEGFYTVRVTGSSGLTASVSNAFELIDDNPFFRILFPQGSEILSSLVQIRWEANPGSYGPGAMLPPDRIMVDIACSADRGHTWMPVATGEENDGLYDWDTALMADGDYLLKITCKAPDQGSEGLSAMSEQSPDRKEIISEIISDAPFTISNGNTPPSIIDISASQQPDGLVAIRYRCIDQEQTMVNVSFQYWDGAAWRPCRSLTGAGMQQAIQVAAQGQEGLDQGQGQGQQSRSGQLLSASWRVRDDFPGHYLKDCKIKILADDGQSFAHLAEGESPAFTLDTIPPKTKVNPAGGTFSRWAKVALSASDDSTVAAVHYTTDGSPPTNGSPLYTAPIMIAGNTSLQFFSVDIFGNQEPVRAEQYLISKRVVVSTTGPVWPGSNMKITCQVLYSDSSLVSGNAISFTISVSGSAAFDPNAVTGTVLQLNSGRNQAKVQTQGGKVVLNLTDDQAEEVHLSIQDTERMGLEISGSASWLLARFLDPDLDEDKDGLPNRLETSDCPKVDNPDSDGDGLPDGYERSHSCLDPCDASTPAATADSGHGASGDPDGDGIDNLAEYHWGTDPCLKDTDGDGLDDGLEWGSDVQHPLDSDADGLIDALELDSDGDRLPDGKEYFSLKTSSTSTDTDQDGKSDGFEVGPDPDHPAFCTDAQGGKCLCALDSGNAQGKPVIESIRPWWTTDGTAAIAVSGQNLTASTLIGIYGQEPPLEVGGYALGAGEASGVCILGNYAYLAAGRSGILIIDISQPDQPFLACAVPTSSFNALDICMAGQYPCVAAGYSGLLVLSQPDGQPVVKGTYNTPGYSNGVWAQGNLVYVADEWEGLQIIDISQPDQPVLKGSLATPDWTYGICGQGNYVYLAAGYSGLLAVDVSQPEDPVLVAGCTIPGSAVAVTVFEGCAYVVDSSSTLQVIDITYPAYPSLMTSIKLPARSQALGLSFSAEYLYLASGSAGLDIFTRPDSWHARTSEVNSSGTRINAILQGEIPPQGSCTVRALNPPYGKADSITLVFETTANTPPQVEVLSASQRMAGQQNGGSVVITYSCLDQEQSEVKILFQYWDGSRWKDCQTVTGSGTQPTGSNLTAVWGAQSDAAGKYLADCRIRIKADDEQSGNCLAEAESTPFPLDTKAPGITVAPVGGSYQTSPTVTLGTDEQTEEGTEKSTVLLYYTTDGSSPTLKSSIYADPIKLSGSTTLKILAVDSYGNQGTIRKEVYTVSAYVPPPPATWPQPITGSGWTPLPLPVTIPSPSSGFSTALTPAFGLPGSGNPLGSSSLFGTASGSFGLPGSSGSSGSFGLFGAYNSYSSYGLYGSFGSYSPYGSISSYGPFGSFNTSGNYLAPSGGYPAPSGGYWLPSGSGNYSAPSYNNYAYPANYGWFGDWGPSLLSSGAAGSIVSSSYSGFLSFPYSF
ncbi:MAG: chitobiase/beta-hexosaminidase C-terminal domain-containing protein [bacterium]